MANSVDPVQTAPIGAVCSGSTLFPSIPNRSVMHGKDFSRRHFQMHFFLGALRVNVNVISGLSIHLYLYFAYASSEGFGEPADMHGIA